MLNDTQTAHPVHWWILIIAIFIMFGVGYSAFVKPTQTNKIASGATQVIYNESPKIPLASVGCWRLNDQLFWNTSTGVKK